MDALLTPNDQMEALSRVYVRGIAARAGYTVGQADPDRDSVDLFVQAGGSMRPQIGIQLKGNYSFCIIGAIDGRTCPRTRRPRWG
jgi:hypothetical protein